MLCEDLDRSMCGDVLFTGFIPTPQIPQCAITNGGTSNNGASLANSKLVTSQDLMNSKNASKPGNVLRLSNSSIPTTPTNPIRSINNNNSAEFSSPQQSLKSNDPSASNNHPTHSRNSSVDFVNTKKSHSRKSSYECSSNMFFYPQTTPHFANLGQRNQLNEIRQMKTDLGSF
jgi:hypothetical protein